ncbi:hypothetical protein HNP67_001217 [Borreliella californiensis]|uniref:Uncharacterized protein n=1 Tax=Borreliella californiensis TaxID=373543 RepID=A0A7X0DRV9_9SPIR|nr:hypothetical protein [Borreliella californiensis]
MRQKWTSNEIYVNKDFRVTISKDTFEHLLAQTFRLEVEARRIRGKLDLECTLV